MAGTHHIGNDTIAGTIGGTLLAIIPHLETTDVLRTIVLGALGAVTSFLASQASKWIWRRIKNKLFNRSKGHKIEEDDKN